MRRFFYGFDILLLIGLFLFSLPQMILAATINFDKTSVTVQSGASFSLQVNVDAGSDEIRSTDIYLKYDGSYLQVESVSEGSFFPTVTSDTATAGQIYIAGMVDDPAVTKTGSGTVATVNFKAVKDGSTTISFDCQNSKIIKADIDATNILTCNQGLTVSISIGEGTNNSNSQTNNNSSITELPKSGVFENVIKFGMPGLMLFIVGGALRLIL